ncbi:hypothetical protein TRVL_10352 [Trypanosoma vivax]|nr:hypothetical protein TRVL_10352 [Trypanosoma vivax]
MCRFSGIASAKGLSASGTARTSPSEIQCGSRCRAPPATHTSPLSLNTSAPHPYMEASATSAADAGRCLRGATCLFPSNELSQRLPCLITRAGRPAPPLSCKSPPLSFVSLRHTVFRKKQYPSRHTRSAHQRHTPSVA